MGRHRDEATLGISCDEQLAASVLDGACIVGNALRDAVSASIMSLDC
jgi:hypothetical protein